MIIFNSTDHPILVRMGDQSYSVDVNRYCEADVETGVHPLFVCQLSADGKKLTFYREHSEDWGRFARKGIVSLAAEGMIEIGRDTKLHIEARRQKSRLYGYGKYTNHLELLACTAENGKLHEMHSVFAKPAQRRYLVASFGVWMAVILFFHGMITWIPLSEWSGTDAWLFVLLFQVLFIAEEWQCIRALRILRKYFVA